MPALRSPAFWNCVLGCSAVGFVLALLNVTTPVPAGWLVVFGFAAVGAGLGWWAGWLLIRREELCFARRLTLRCERCGYDRRGNVSGVCPECGSPGVAR